MSKKKLVSVAVASLLALGGSLGLATGASAVVTNSSTRIAGADRYETSVAVSQAKIAVGTNASKTGVLASGTIYIASGEVYADALVGAPLAEGTNEVLLLATANDVPTTVEAELKRLTDTASATKTLDNPLTAIKIIGGTGSVSNAVAVEIANLTGIVPTRISGADRYATAVEVSKLLGGNKVLLASGENFPDALAAAALAASNTNAMRVLLTKAGELPSATSAELTRLTPAAANLDIIGGTGSVSATVVNAAKTASGIAASTDVERLYGADRYDTAAAVAGKFGTMTAVRLASGAEFPDALAAATLAKPVLLVQAASIPLDACGFIGAQNSTAIVVGGTASVSDTVISSAATCKLNTAAPVITATTADLITKLGGTFNPLTGVSAYDAQDGDLTSKVTYKVEKFATAGTPANGAVAGSGDLTEVSAWNNAAAGSYKITYTVRDSGGRTDTETRLVSVFAAATVSWAGTTIPKATDLGLEVLARDWEGATLSLANADGHVVITAFNNSAGASATVTSGIFAAPAPTTGQSMTLTYTVTDPDTGLETVFRYSGLVG